MGVVFRSSTAFGFLHFIDQLSFPPRRAQYDFSGGTLRFAKCILVEMHFLAHVA
jgi:hypothetical protein